MHAGLAEGLDEIFAGSFPRHLHESQLGNLEDIGPRLVLAQCVSQSPVGLLPVICRLHVDEVDDDQPTDISEAKLVDHFLDGFEVGFVDRVLEIAFTHEAAGVDVNGREGFALIHDQRTPGLEPDLALEVRVDLGLQPHPLEKRLKSFVAIHLGLGIRDEFVDELFQGFEGFGLIDHDSLGLRTRGIAHYAQGQIGFRMKDAGRVLFRMGQLNSLPDGAQVTDIGLEVGFPYPVPGGANDKAEVFGPYPVDDLAQALALLVGIDSARNTDPG